MANTWGVGSLQGVESSLGEFISGPQNTWATTSLGAQEASLGLLSSGPWVRSITPVSTTCVDRDTVAASIELAVSGGDLIDQSTILIEVSTDGCVTWNNVYASSAFDAAWTGSAANSTEGLLDVWTFTALEPTAGYDYSTEYCFRINADDDNGDSMAEFTFAFDTCPAVEAIADPAVVEKDGGYLISISVNSSYVPAGLYNIFIGSYQAGGDLVGTESGANTVFSVPTPVMPVGGPYDVRFVGLDDATDVTAFDVVTVVPHLFRSGTLSLRNKLSRLWALGWRREQDEEFPQS